MPGVTSYLGKYHVWKAPIMDEMYSYEGKGNPKLWFAKCDHCKDMVVCGLNTKRETLVIMDEHLDECIKKG